MNIMEKVVDVVLPNEIIIELENQIKNELRNSLESLVDQPQKHIMQVMLLHHRLNFTSKLEE
jgi:hypothetical protein